MERDKVSIDLAAEIKRAGNGGELRFLSPRFASDRLGKLKDGERVSVCISARKPKRTVAQNNYWWVYMTMIAEETGYTPDDVHEAVKAKFLTGPRLNVLGQEVRIVGSTTKLSRRGFGELIDRVADWTGITPPDTEGWL